MDGISFDGTAVHTGKSAVLRIADRREDGTVETAESLCTDRYSAFYMAAVMRGKRLVGPIRLLSVFLAITVLLGFCQKHMKKLRLVCLALGSMIFLSSCGAVEPEKRLYPLAVAFDYMSEEATAPENSETGEETGTAVSESGGERRRLAVMARLVCACESCGGDRPGKG